MAVNVNDLFTNLLYRLRSCPEQESRNGRVRSMGQPILFTTINPKQRVLFNPLRKCNPYLHVMETVWMFAGENSVEFLLPFSKQMEAYAEPDGVINGAYGHRWRSYFGRDQIMGVINELARDPDSRQAVIGMYDPAQDWKQQWNDRPCNTHIYFRKYGGALDMTVCNRSNDVVWGACGANIVHMTYLQELVATALKCPVGSYNVMSNNLHIYEHHYNLLNNPQSYDYYHDKLDVNPLPLLGANESDVYEFLNECEAFVRNGPEGTYKSSWINGVVIPMYQHYMCRLNGDKDTYDTSETLATDWRLAENLWREWNDN